MMISSSIHLPENDIILFFFMTKNSKDSTRRLLDLIHTFSKVICHKISTQKLTASLCTNNELFEKLVRKTLPFSTALSNKISSINITKDVKDLYKETIKH
jgi:hypothetical protein